MFRIFGKIVWLLVKDKLVFFVFVSFNENMAEI